MSTVFRANQISLHHGQKKILQEVSFELHRGEIVGVVGRNGSGKSSLLKVVAGKMDLDGGQLQFTNGISVGYLPQEFELREELTVLQTVFTGWLETKLAQNSEDLVWVADLPLSQKQAFEVGFMGKNSYGQSKPEKFSWWPDPVKHELLYEYLRAVLQDLHCAQREEKIVREMSGGERRKVALAKILAGAPDLLILDEPTNHLDIEMLESLEKRLKNYPGSVLLVSHDRYFLDKLVTRMLEVFDGQIFEHSGNYQDFLESKLLRQEIAESAESKKNAFLKRELEWVRAGVKARGTKDKGRLQRFYDLKEEKGFYEEGEMELILPKAQPLGNKIINLEKVDLVVGEKKILEDFNFSFQAKNVLGLVGANGAGKTSFIKAILGEMPIQRGKIVVGQNTVFNYQDQEKWNLNLENTVFEEISNSQELTEFGSEMINTRAYLRRFLFDGDKILSQIKTLSGGERARILLAKLLKIGGNCLILDEPTNDLDLETISLLEESILNFAGVVIVVSHDRYFLNRVCNYILALEGNGRFTLSTGNYDNYLSKKRPNWDLKNVEKIPDPLKISQKEVKNQQKELKNVEKEIGKLEAEIKKVEEEFLDPEFYTKNPKKYLRRTQELENMKQSLTQLMEKWEQMLV